MINQVFYCLLNDQEKEALERSFYSYTIDRMVYNDPDFGLGGSGDYWVCYFITPRNGSEMITIGRAIESAIRDLEIPRN